MIRRLALGLVVELRGLAWERLGNGRLRSTVAATAVLLLLRPDLEGTRA